MLVVLLVATIACAMLTYYKVYYFVRFQADIRVRNLTDLQLRYEIYEYVRRSDVPSEMKAMLCIFESCGPAGSAIILLLALSQHRNDFAILAAIVFVVTTIGAIRTWILVYRNR
jgi:hypothetical protein